MISIDAFGVSEVIFPLAKEMLWVDISLLINSACSGQSITATVQPKSSTVQVGQVVDPVVQCSHAIVYAVDKPETVGMSDSVLQLRPNYI